MVSKREPTLSPKKSQVISLILEGYTQRRAAKDAGVSEETVSRWKSEDTLFASTLENYRRDLYESQAQKLLDLSGKAVNTLGELLKSEDEGIRLRASQAVLKATMPEPPSPKTGDLFATNQVSPDTERCYRYQLRNFAQWMQTGQGKIELEDVTAVDLLTYKQSLSHLASPRPVTILTRRITYPMRMPYGKRGPYHKRNKSKVGVA